jgi:hypothetical protein
MSRSAPSSGIDASPGEGDMPTSGHGFGLSWQKRRKSAANVFGSTARLACT